MSRKCATHHYACDCREAAWDKVRKIIVSGVEASDPSEEGDWPRLVAARAALTKALAAMPKKGS